MEEKPYRRPKSLTPSLLDKHIAVTLGCMDEDVVQDSSATTSSLEASTSMLSDPTPTSVNLATSTDVALLPGTISQTSSVHFTETIEKQILPVVEEDLNQGNTETAPVSAASNSHFPSDQNSQSQSVVQVEMSVTAVSDNGNGKQFTHLMSEHTQSVSNGNNAIHQDQNLKQTQPSTTSQPQKSFSSNTVTKPAIAVSKTNPLLTQSSTVLQNALTVDLAGKVQQQQSQHRMIKTDQAMQPFWDQVLQETQDIDHEEINFKEQSVPLQRCKDIFDTEKKHLGLNNIFVDGSGVVTMSKICELLILEMTKRSLLSRENVEDKSPINVQDVLNAIRDQEIYDLFAEHL